MVIGYLDRVVSTRVFIVKDALQLAAADKSCRNDSAHGAVPIIMPFLAQDVGVGVSLSS
jgi:hypothetical protein